MNDEFKFRCPKCHQEYSCSYAWCGHTLVCQCKSMIRVPSVIPPVIPLTSENNFSDNDFLKEHNRIFGEQVKEQRRGNNIFLGVMLAIIGIDLFG